MQPLRKGEKHRGAVAKFDRQEILDNFERTRSFSETARHMGCSRERIRQVVKIHRPDLKARLHHDKWSECVMCGRAESDGFQMVRHYCARCYNRVRLNIPPPLLSCRMCAVPFTKRKRRGQGMCGRCYQKYVRTKTTYWKESQKRYREKHKDEIRERQRGYSRAYYRSHKEELRHITREWQIKNKEKVRAYYRAYYRRNREALLLKAKIRRENGLLGVSQTKER